MAAGCNRCVHACAWTCVCMRAMCKWCVLLFQSLSGLSADYVPSILLFISEDDCVKTWNHDLQLTLHDKRTLLSSAWLSANHITAANYVLKLKYPNQNGLQDTIYLRDKLIWQLSAEKFVNMDVIGCV